MPIIQKQNPTPFDTLQQSYEQLQLAHHRTIETLEATRQELGVERDENAALRRQIRTLRASSSRSWGTTAAVTALAALLLGATLYRLSAEKSTQEVLKTCLQIKDMGLSLCQAAWQKIQPFITHPR